MKIITTLSILAPIILAKDGFLYNGYLDKCLNLDAAAGEDLSFHYKRCNNPTFKSDGSRIKYQDGAAALKIDSNTIYSRLSARPGASVAIRADGVIVNGVNGKCIDTKKDPGNFVEKACQGMVEYKDGLLGLDIAGNKIQSRCWRFTENNVLNAGGCEVKYNDRQWYKANKHLLPEGTKMEDVFKFKLDDKKNVVTPMSHFIEAKVHRHRHGDVIYQPVQIAKKDVTEDKFIMFQDSDGIIKFRNNAGTKCIEKVQYLNGQIMFGRCLVDSFMWVEDVAEE